MPARDGAAPGRKGDRNRPRLPLQGNGRRSPVCQDDVGLQADQLLRQSPYPMSLDISWWIRRNDYIEPRCFRATVSVESPSEITMSTVERVRASRSKGLARAAVIAGVGRYLEDVFRPEEGIPDAPIAVANRSSTRRHWLGGLYAGLGYMGQEQTGRPHRYEVGPTPLPKCCVMWIAKLPVHGAGLVSRSCTTSLDRY